VVPRGVSRSAAAAAVAAVVVVLLPVASPPVSDRAVVEFRHPAIAHPAPRWPVPSETGV